MFGKPVKICYILFEACMEEKESGYQTFPDYVMRSAGRPRMVNVLAVLFILLALILGGLFMIGAIYKKPKPAVLPSPTVSPATTPLPTSSVSAVLKPDLTGTLFPTAGLSTKDISTNLDRSKLKVSVLNGSGEKGAAKQVSSYLESLGYQIVKVGNADVFTYRNLTVQVKKSQSAYAPLLKRDLQAAPNAVNASLAFASVSASVSDEITNDAEVIVGR